MAVLDYVETFGTMTVGTLSALGMLLEGLFPGQGFTSSIYYLKNGATIITLIACAIALPSYDRPSVAYYSMGYFFALVLTALGTYSKQVYDWWLNKREDAVHWFVFRWAFRLVCIGSLPLPGLFLIRRFWVTAEQIFSSTEYFASIPGSLALLLIIVVGSLSCMIWLVVGVYMIWTEPAEAPENPETKNIEQIAIDTDNPRHIVVNRLTEDKSDAPKVNVYLGYGIYLNVAMVLAAFGALIVYSVIRRHEYAQSEGPVDQCFDSIDEEELLICAEYQRIGHLWVLVAAQFLPIFVRLGDH